MYNAFIEDEKITGAAPNTIKQGALCVEITEEQYNSMLQYGINYYMWNGSEVVLNPNYEEEQAQKEQERINNLTMTPLDFIGVLQSLGLTLEQINAFLESNLNIKMQLTYCNSVYCGVVKSFLPITVDGVTVTPEMVESAFITKNGGM